MNIGVIGGSGFIGSHIVDKLVEANHDVVVLDMKNPRRNDVEFVSIDILNASKTTLALNGAFDFNVVYLLAAVADVNYAFKNPLVTTELNVLGTVNVLEAASKNDIDRVILASTIWVYGLTDELGVDENTPLNLSKTNHLYTSSKVSAELLCHSYAKLYDQDFTILRYGIPYGPRARSSTVTATFAKKILNNESIIIHGSGKQTRNFVYVEDLADGNVLALSDVAINQTYNLDGLRAISIREVAETVKRLLKSDTEIEYTADRIGDYSKRLISIEKARKELGWNPNTGFEDGVKMYLKWLEEDSK